VLVFLGIFFITKRNPVFEVSAIKEIHLTAQGIEPKRLVINMGDNVLFINDTQIPFWPASDPHPTHNINPQFDTRRPLNQNETWSYRFQNPGVWRFHDHLASASVGEVVVLSKTGRVVLPDCKSNETTPDECYQIDIVTVLNKDGLDKALDRMAVLYNTEPGFKDSCHAVSHILGKSAYHIFEEGGSIKLSGKTSYCSYGFYHGFMEEMLQMSGNPDQARKFCSDAGKTLSKESSNAEGACYHGIGHGAADGSDPRAWGDPVALVNPAIELCNRVDPTEPHFYRCASGVFNSLALMYIYNSYNLKFSDLENPFSVCKNWTTLRVKDPCYQEMNSIGMKMMKGDLAVGIKLVEKIDDEAQYSVLAMRSLAAFAPAVFSQPVESNFKKIISACQNARKDLVIPCIQGIPSGLMEFGSPGREYEFALAFCKSKELTDSQKSECFKTLSGGVRSYYSPQKQATICALFDEKYGGVCTKE
jgi:hypothetical protein